MTITVSPLDSLPLVYSARQALAAFGQLTATQGTLPDAATLLFERAFMLGLKTRDRCSPNGSCHLVPCKDGMLAINLPRPSDWELIPAWLGPWHDDIHVAAEDWSTLTSHCQHLAATDLIQQARTLGLAVALASELPPPPAELARHSNVRMSPPSPVKRHRGPPLVLDLSSLWAGPLCSHLLQRAGCRVIKVEGQHRLDGARTGTPDFYHLLNQGKESVVLDFRAQADIARLRQLIAHADIVIEGSRPRALHQLGIRPEELIQSQPGLVWISITGYGREGEKGNWIGFGDDTAAAAGLCKIMQEACGEYQIVGDAIADPLTGIHAALLAWQSFQAGGNELIALSLQDTVSFCLHQELLRSRDTVLAGCRTWLQFGTNLNALFPSGNRTPQCAAAAAGQHNEAVFEALDASN